jgi:hypothetical protein
MSPFYVNKGVTGKDVQWNVADLIIDVGETPIDDRPEFRAWLDSMHQAAKDYVESKRLRLGLPTPVFDEASGHPQTVAYKLVRPTKRV